MKRKLIAVILALATLLTLGVVPLGVAEAAPAIVAGNSTISRSTVDTWSTFYLVDKNVSFNNDSIVTGWRIYAANTRKVGFMIYRYSAGAWHVVYNGSGSADLKTPTTSAVNTYSLTTPVLVKAGDFVGLYFDGAEPDLGGTVPFDSAGSAGVLYTNQGASATDFASGGADVRTYSVQALGYTGVKSASMTATPYRDVNPVGGSHTITVNIGATAANVPVMFTFTAGPNTSLGPYTRLTNSSGIAQLTYSDVGGSGFDVILIWVDQDGSGGFTPAAPPTPSDPFTLAFKSWVENYVTGGGNLAVDGKKAAYTFSGTVGGLPGGGVDGQFQIEDHINKKSYVIDNFTFVTDALHPAPFLVFGGSPADSPQASHHVSVFAGSGSGVAVQVAIADNSESAPKEDQIAVYSWNGTAWKHWFGGLWNNAPNAPVITGGTISGGNFQVHDVN